MQRSSRRSRSPRRSRLSVMLLAIVALAASVVLGSCGDDDEPARAKAGNGVDLAFVTTMTPHHDSAVDMAKVAAKRSDRPEIQSLAEDIIRSQTAEITQMRQLADVLKDDDVSQESLGVAEHDMGMSMNMQELESAEPFDQAFIDAMIPHHQGAIRMARAVLDKGDSAEVEKLAKAIIAAQSREIDQMNAWRKAWYGAESPAGGVPEVGEETDPSMPGHSM